MKNTPLEHQRIPDRCRSMIFLNLRQDMPVPVVLLFILFLGTLAGTGLFLKTVALQAQIEKLQADNTRDREVQALRMSNEWLKNRVAVLQEENAELLDSAVADLSEKSSMIANQTSTTINCEFDDGPLRRQCIASEGKK